MLNNYIVVSAITIAVMSLGAAIWMAHAIRQHNMLRVRPLLGFHLKVVSGEPVVLVLRNLGAGPAVIRRFNLMLDQTCYDTAIEGGFEQYLNDLGLDTENMVWRVNEILPGALVAAGELISVLEISASANTHEFYESVRNNRARVSVDAAYACIYGGEFEMRDHHAHRVETL